MLQMQGFVSLAENRNNHSLINLTMKKLFFALALAGFLAVPAVNTVSAMTHAKVIVKGGEEDKNKKKDKKDSKKDAKCCSKDAANASASDKKACAEGKTCSKGTSCCHAGAKTETKTETKKAEETK